MKRNSIIERSEKWWNHELNDILIGVGFYKEKFDWNLLPLQSKALQLNKRTSA